MIQDAISRLVALRGLLNSLDRGDVDRELSTVIEELENETPITPEALEAAGWKKTHETWRLNPGSPITMSKSTEGWYVRSWAEGIRFPSLKTMEQLSQLLEMMGAEQ